MVRLTSKTEVDVETMSSRVISFINFCLNEITERSYEAQQSLGKQLHNPLKTEITQGNYVNIGECAEHNKEKGDFDDHKNNNQPEEINGKQSEIQHLRGCINQEKEHTIKNKESKLIEQADNNCMSCAFGNNVNKMKRGNNERNCEKNFDLEESNRKKANHRSDNSGIICSTGVQKSERDNENKKKRKHDCFEDINTNSSTGGVTEFSGCKKKKKKHQEGGDSAGEKNTFDLTKSSFSEESVKNKDLLNNGSSQNVLKTADTQHKAKRKYKHYSKTKVESGDVEQDCIPIEQQEEMNVCNDITLNSDIQQSFPDTSRKRKKKKPKNLDGAKLIEYYKLLDEIRVLTKKKEAATIGHKGAVCDLKNNSTPVKKKKEKDNEWKNKVHTPVDYEDFQNRSAVYTHTYTYTVSSISQDSCHEKNAISSEQRGKTDIQSNDDGDIHQCIVDTPVKRKKKNIKQSDISSNKSTNLEERGLTSGIEMICKDTLEKDLSRHHVERVDLKVDKASTSNTPKKSKRERKTDREHTTSIQTPNTYTDSINSSMEQTTSSKPSWLNVFSPVEEFSPEKLKWLRLKENNEEIRDAIATFNDNFYLTHQNLKNLHIIIDWEVPLLHTIETRPSCVPTKQQVELINRLNLEVKKGYFSKEENDTILKNFEEFCMKHDLPLDPRPFIKLRIGKDESLTRVERIHFVQYLAKGLNNRLLNTVYRRFQNMVIPRNCTGRRFSAEEDKLIVDSIEKDKLSLTDLGKLLSRHPHSILKRHDVLSNGKYCCDWSLDAAEKLLKAMMEVTLVVKVEELKHRHIHEEEWRRIAKKVDKYAMVLKETWYRKLHPQLFIPKHVSTEEVIRKVIHRLRASNVTNWNEIKWNELVEPFEGWTGLYLKHIMYGFLRHAGVGHKSNLKEFYDYLLKQVAKMPFRKRKTLVYEDGRLIPT